MEKATNNDVHLVEPTNAHLASAQEAEVIRLTALGGRKRDTFKKSTVEAAQMGEREAFDRLVERHAPAIRKFISKRVSKVHVDDLLQDIWLAAWTSLGEFDRRSQFKTWLYGIAINKCKSHYRGQLRRNAHVPLDEGLGVAEVSHQVPELADHLPTLLTKLSSTHRELLDLYYYAELTLPEISKLLDRNLNTVKYQFYRAHAEMASLLREVSR